MNRKAQIKLNREVAKKKALYFSHPFDDPGEWLKGIPSTPPWPADKIKDYQKRLDSAFGGEGAIILAWSGDRKYGDAFYTDWHATGLPKGRLERKPPLLFAEQKINETDYFYVSCPRWLLLEVLDRSQYEDGWEAAAWVESPEYLGGRKRIRALTPPRHMYKHLLTVASHDDTYISSEMPQCCVKMLNQKRICFGRYKEPSDAEIAVVRNIRESQDRMGIVQRNDTERSQKLIENATLATRHFIRRAQEQQAIGVKEMMLGNSEAFFGDLLKRTGSTMSFKEMEAVVAEGLDQQMDERFGSN